MSAQVKYSSRQLGIGLLVLLVFAMVIFALASYLSDPHTAGSYLNPDINTLTYMAYNVIYEHGNFFAWHVSTSLSFIPEMAFFFVVVLFSKNPFFNLLLYAFFQVAWTALIIPAIIKASTKTSIGLRLGIVSLFVLLITVVLKHSLAPYYQYAYISTILLPGFHFGAALLVFTLVFVYLKILNNPKIYVQIIFFVLLVLFGLSDPLVYVYFTFPMIVTVGVLWFYQQLSKKESLLCLSILVASFIFGHIIYHLLPIQNFQWSLKPIFSWLLVFYFIKTILFFVQKNFVWGILWFIFMFCAPCSLWQTFKNKENSRRLIDYVILLQFLTVIVSIPVIILAVNQTFGSDQQIYPKVAFFAHPIQFYRELGFLPYRYFINFFIGPVFLGFPLLLYKHRKQWVDRLGKNIIYVVILILFFIILFFLKAHHFHKNTLLHFQSKLAVCIEGYAKKYQLTNGVSDSYYVTNMVNSYAAGKIHIALIDSFHLTVIRWQNSQKLYQYHDYNFAISNDKDMPTAIQKIYGTPIHTFVCTGNYNDDFTLYIYPKGKLDNFFDTYLKTQH